MSKSADGEIVQFDNVGLRYGADREVLSDISFTLYPGSFYFLTGASGAGKTSLLRLLYLAQRPSRGMIRMFGDDAITLPRERLPALRGGWGWCFRISGWSRTCPPSIMSRCRCGLRALPKRMSTSRCATCSTGWGWRTGWMRAPATLSGGEQQRVAIARAVIGRPEILVADEPTGNVDPDMAVKLLRLFEALNRLGTTVLVATHDLHLLQKVPDSMIMRLDKGRMMDPTGALRFPPRRPSSSAAAPHEPQVAPSLGLASGWRPLAGGARGAAGAAGAAVGADALGDRDHGGADRDCRGHRPVAAQHRPGGGGGTFGRGDGADRRA